MVGYKQVLCALLFTILSTLAVAQNNTNSPYTRYGYGQLNDRSSAKNKGMGGAGFGVRDGLQMNLTTPASYTAIDSLTLLFEGGVTLQNTNFSNGVTKVNAKNSSFDYVAMQLRLHRRLALTAGMVPFSNVGYNLSSSGRVEGSADDVTSTTTYTGDGGLQKIFVGLGFKILPNLSVGANASYIWGNIDRNIALSFSQTSIDRYTELHNMAVNDVVFDLGLQYTHIINKKNSLTLGLVYTPGKNLNTDATITSYNSAYVSSGNNTGFVPYNQTVIDTAAVFGTPASYGAGLTYVYNNRLTVAVDYSLQKWSKEKYMDDPDAFNDRQKIAFGVEYLPNSMGRSYFSFVRYRLGAYYSKPYYKIRLNDTGSYGSAKEFGVSGGISLPVPRSKSMVHLTAQYVRVDGMGANMLDENYLRIGIGLTFNERWFFKRKVD